MANESKDKQIIKDDEFLLEKLRKDKKLGDLKINTDYAESTGKSFFHG